MAQDGLTWATIVSIVLAFMKFFEGRKKKAAYDRMERKIDALISHGSVKYSELPEEQITKLIRRKTNMHGINWITLFAAVLGAIKIVLQAFGIDVVTDEQINSIANGLAAIMTVVGVAMTHRKVDKPTPQAPVETPTHDPQAANHSH